VAKKVKLQNLGLTPTLHEVYMQIFWTFKVCS